MLRVTLLCILLSSTSGMFSQVTIGSATKPEQGALLDLKQFDDAAAKAGGPAAVMGLGLPRVKLKYLTVQPNESLAQTVDGNPSSEVWDSDSHTGLVVYNVSGDRNCGPIPDGVYVWDGQKWVGLFDKVEIAPAALSITGDREYYVPSGLGLEKLPSSTPPSFTLNWSPIDMPASYTNTPDATWGGVTFSGANAPSGASGSLATSPATIVLSADAMTATDIASNPFRTKLSTLTFRATDECGDGEITEIVTINQTNKALVIDNSSRIFTASASNATNKLTANADWKLKSIVPATSSAISNVRVGTPPQSLSTDVTQAGFERNDNTGLQTTLTYNVYTGSSYAKYNFLTFEDANPTKRFPDVTLSLAQCVVNQENDGPTPTIEEWAIIGGFTQAEIDAVKSTGEDSRILPNGMQMHLIKNSARGPNQIFLSSNFGQNPMDSDQRWMIHNLDAIAYDYAGSPTNPTLGVLSSGTSPRYIFPNGGSNGSIQTTFDENQRYGLMYNWRAASANKTNVSDQGALAGASPSLRVQGICPAGWHLPSDNEWTLLERDNVRYKSEFSSIASPTGTALSNELDNSSYGVALTGSGTSPSGPYTGYRGTESLSSYANVMTEPCEQSDDANVRGASNIISSSKRPGFGAIYTGYTGYDQRLYYVVNQHYRELNQFWTSSSGPTVEGRTQSWTRSFEMWSPLVYRGHIQTTDYASVRCIKD